MGFYFYLKILGKIAIINLMNRVTKGVIILTSTGLSAEPVRRTAKRFFDSLQYESVAIVTTAAEGKENNEYSTLAKSQFKELGFRTIDFIDIENEPEADFSKYSVIYVCGGNTFKLLKYAREANFKNTIIRFLERDGVYIGVSAGAIILAPTIQIAGSVDPEPNEVDITDLDGLRLVSFEIHPHYDPSQDKELSSYQKTTTNKIVRISNSQAVVLSNLRQQVIG